MRKSRMIGLGLTSALALALVSTAVAQDSVTIRLWGHGSSPAEEAALAEQVASFMEANPNITVEVSLLPDYDTQLQAAFASGDYPEVFYVGQDAVDNFVDAGVIADGSMMIEDPSGIYPSLVNAFSFGGTLWCPAKDFSNLALQYNTAYFDAAGLEYPNADWTWDDLRASAEALAASGTLPEGAVPLVLNPDMDRWLAFYVQAGGELYDADGNFTFASEGANYDAAIAALGFFSSLNNDGLSATSADLGGGWPGESFGQGNGAMTMEGNWIISYLLDQFPDTAWGVTELPAGPGGEGTLTFSECYGVAADNEYPEESWMLVNFLTGAEGSEMIAQGGFGPMPPRTASAATWLAARGEEYAAFVDGSANAVAPVMPVGFQEFRDELNNGIALSFEGTPIEDAINDAVDVANELIEENM
jgi:multiple sugar transport system substrate-binding protein